MLEIIANNTATIAVFMLINTMLSIWHIVASERARERMRRENVEQFAEWNRVVQADNSDYFHEADACPNCCADRGYCVCELGGEA